MKATIQLTASQLREAATLAENIETMNQKLTALLNGTTFTSTKATTSGGKRVLSPAVKARIAAGQKARWAAKNAAKAATPAPAVAPATA